MKLSVKQIKDASRCLRYLQFSLQEPLTFKENKEVRIADEVIRKGYVQALETSFKPQWRRVLAWVDKRVFVNVDINDIESFTKAKITSEHILTFVKTWYRNILIPEHVLAYPSVAIEMPISSSEVSTDIPVIKLGEKPTIFSVSNVVCNDWELYNDIEVRTQALLVDYTLHCKNVIYHRIAMGPRGGFNENIIELTEEHHKATEKMITQVVQAVERKMNYPSFTKLCSECPYYRRCRI